MCFRGLCHCFRACVIVAQVHQPLASPCSCASGACGALPSLGLRITGFAGINDGNSLTVLLQAPTCIADISQDKPTVTLNRINQERNPQLLSLANPRLCVRWFLVQWLVGLFAKHRRCCMRGFRLASNETAATTPWRNLNPSRLQPQLW